MIKYILKDTETNKKVELTKEDLIEIYQFGITSYKLDRSGKAQELVDLIKE